jgi:hypothetical protein
MKQTLLILFAAACLSSCTIENHCNHDQDRSYNRESSSEEAYRQRMREMPTSTNVSTRTTNIVSYNTSTPVVRTYHYSTPVVRTYHYPTPAVTYRRYYNTTNYAPVVRTNCAPVVRTNCTPTLVMRAGSNRYEVVGRSYTPVVRRRHHH